MSAKVAPFKWTDLVVTFTVDNRNGERDIADFEVVNGPHPIRAHLEVCGRTNRPPNTYAPQAAFAGKVDSNQFVVLREKLRALVKELDGIPT